MSPNNTSVLLIYTGGTIGMIENAETGALESFNFEHLQKHVPSFRILRSALIPISSIRLSTPLTWNLPCGPKLSQL